VSSYNFLSRYGPEGKCEPHLDHPNAMFTFDYCIDQDEVWPIYISGAAAWPDAAFARNFDPAALKADPAMAFREHALRPNNALIFNGSSQWHYREPKSSGQRTPGSSAICYSSTTTRPVARISSTICGGPIAPGLRNCGRFATCSRRSEAKSRGAFAASRHLPARTRPRLDPL